MSTINQRAPHDPDFKTSTARNNPVLSLLDLYSDPSHLLDRLALPGSLHSPDGLYGGLCVGAAAGVGV